MLQGRRRSGWQPGWPAVQRSPWAKQMRCLHVLLPSVPCSSSLATETEPSLCGTPGDPCSPAPLLLFFSTVPPFIRLTSISEIRITWSRQETLQTWRIYFPRKKWRCIEALRRTWIRFCPENCGCESTGGLWVRERARKCQFAFCEMRVQKNCTSHEVCRATSPLTYEGDRKYKCSLWLLQRWVFLNV